jgi:hypothetical protein
MIDATVAKLELYGCAGPVEGAGHDHDGGARGHDHAAEGHAEGRRCRMVEAWAIPVFTSPSRWT